MINKFKALTALGLIVGLGFTAAPVRADDMAAKPKPATLNAASATVIATVGNIDYGTRMVTLTLADGSAQTMQVGPEVQRLNEIKKGDHVKIEYLEAVAIQVQSPDQHIDSAMGSSTAVVRNKSKKPSGMVVQTNMLTATVQKVDVKNRTAVLKGPDGNVFTVDVPADVAHLENVHAGDQILVKHTLTVAMSIVKAD